MPYLRKTVTYSVVTESGEELLVDEFDPTEPLRGHEAQGESRRRLMLRDGEAVRRLADGTLQRVETGEQLTIVSKQ